MSKKMSDIKWSDARKIEHVWVEDLEDPSLSAFCEEDGGVYFVVETCESMGNFSDVEEGILRVYRNPELLQLENDSLTAEVERLREALDKAANLVFDELGAVKARPFIKALEGGDE